jgi:uncharacterized cysteine cluster protein YcgN (CxxCxxCC family)
LNKEPFWKQKDLADMDRTEWEMLCDGCGKCCLFKLEYKELHEVRYTNVACQYLNILTCRCKSYWNRHALVAGCMVLDSSRVQQFYWLPRTCTYRLLYEGKELPEWHHLVSGDPDTIHKLGHSVKGKVISEEFIHPKQLAEHVTDWE